MFIDDDDTVDDVVAKHIKFAEDNAADDPEFTTDAAISDDNDDDNSAEDTKNALTTEIPTETVGEGDPDAATTDNTTGESTGENEGTQQELTQTTTKPVPTNKTTADAEGNFVDAEGKIIARAGSERRMYERLQRSERSAQFFEGEVTRLQQESEQVKALNGIPAKYNLNEQEIGLGLQIIDQLKTNPVEAGRWILQEVMKNGYNLQQILGEVEGVPSSSMDMGAVTRIIQEQLQPITSKFQEQESATQTETDNQRNAERFIATHEYADVHLDPIVNLMKQNPQMSSERAYFEVRQYAQANSLDFSQPLGPQIEARRNTGSNVQNQPNRAMPNGTATSTTETQQPATSSADDDWDSIINQSMSDAGM